MKYFYIPISFFILFSFFHLPTYAQHQRCLADDFYHSLLASDTTLYQKQREIEQFTERWIKENKNAANSRDIITIPIVVHVVWFRAEENISDEQIQSQIDVLNRDFRGLNANLNETPSEFQHLIADTEIEFCLASRAPDGSPTNGITRRQTTEQNIAFSFANQTTFQRKIKNVHAGGTDPWDTQKYVNIWVGSGGNNVLSIAGDGNYPGFAFPTEDGIVIDYRAFGTIGTATTLVSLSKGRTTIHEMGHYLNLRHLWGFGTNCGDDDCILDTPPQSKIDFNCPNHPSPSCGTNDMTTNYMTFVNDDCMTFFTEGQKWRMLAALYGPRNGLLSSDGCGDPYDESIVNVFDQDYVIFPNPARNTLSVQVRERTNLRAINMLTIDNKLVEGCAFLSEGRLHTLDISNVPAGIYLVRIVYRNGTEIFEKIVIVK